VRHSRIWRYTIEAYERPNRRRYNTHPLMLSRRIFSRTLKFPEIRAPDVRIVIDDALTDYEEMLEAQPTRWTVRTHVNCNRRVVACKLETSEFDVGSKITKRLVKHGQMSRKRFDRCRCPGQKQFYVEVYGISMAFLCIGYLGTEITIITISAMTGGAYLYHQLRGVSKACEAYRTRT